jgi:hypothetical protein
VVRRRHLPRGRHRGYARAKLCELRRQRADQQLTSLKRRQHPGDGEMTLEQFADQRRRLFGVSVSGEVASANEAVGDLRQRRHDDDRRLS